MSTGEHPATPRRRGRPRAVERTSDLQPREEILRHAAALFSTAGVGATRIADIAVAVGMTPPAIYHYVDNLDAIVEALLGYVVDESAAYATAAANGPGPGAERLRSLVRQHVERLTSGPYGLWFVAGLSESRAAATPRSGARPRSGGEPSPASSPMASTPVSSGPPTSTWSSPSSPAWSTGRCNSVTPTAASTPTRWPRWPSARCSRIAARRPSAPAAPVSYSTEPRAALDGRVEP